MPEWAESTQLQAGGKRLEARCLGPRPEDAPTIVMLHEGLGSVGLWRDFPDKLSEASGLGCLVYSRAGYGRSESITLPRPLDYMSREAEVLLDVIDAFDLRRVILLGHSDGATIAAIHSGLIGDPRVAGLVLMAPHFFTEDEGLTEIARARDAFESGGLRDKLARHHDDVDVAFWGWCDAWLAPGFRDWNVTEVIGGIKAPVLAIQGRDDAYGTLKQIEVLTSRCQSSVETLILNDCGHSPHGDHPQIVLDAIARFSKQ